jgi:tripartite-type tricarboxylate transporter receptor subunit TctC
MTSFKFTRRQVAALAAGAFLTLGASAASAQSWPTKPVRIVTAASAGSGPDVSLRLIAEKLAQKWGQSVVVDNRPGGNGVVAYNAFRGAAADGHDLIHLDSTMLTSNVHLYSKLPYDPQKDFDPIRPTLQTDFFVVVAKDSPFNTVDDIVAAARAKPDSLNYGSWGQGSPGHLGALRLQSTTNTKMQHVPYKEMPQLFAAVATGEVQWAMGSMASAGPMEKAGRVRFIGVAAPQASAYYPSAPGMSASSSAKDFVSNAWFAVFAPKGTSKGLRDKIAADMTEAMASPDLTERYKGLGYNRFDIKPDDFAQYIQKETQIWGKIISDAKLKLD